MAGSAVSLSRRARPRLAGNAGDAGVRALRGREPSDRQSGRTLLFHPRTRRDPLGELAECGRRRANRRDGGVRLVLTDCREWTRIEPPTDPSGDRPGFFIDKVRGRPDAPAVFAPPAAP